MRISPAKLTLLIAILIVSHVVPALHAVTSCCAQTAVPSTSVAISADASQENVDRCCSNDSVEHPLSDRPCDDQDLPSPEQPELPCDGDCACTLCRAAAPNPIQIPQDRGFCAARAGGERLIVDRSRFLSRDQRFDLLRPPQL